MAQELETLAVALVAETNEFKSGLDSADNIAQGWAGKLGGAVGGLIQGAVMVGAAAAAAAVISIGTAAFDVSSQVNTATADIAASLGVPTDEARRFAEVAREVYGNNFADSVTDAAAGVAEVAKQLGLAADDPSLQKMTENAYRLRDSFGMELPESISAAKTLMDNFGIDGEHAFDLIALAQQRGLDRSGDLLDTINEYSTQFASGGASVSDFFGLIESGAAGGALGTDKAADAFKEFRIRIQDGSKLTAESLESIGLSSENISAQMAAGTLTARDAFVLVQQALNNVEDPVARMQAGVGLLGTQYEDLGDDIAGALTFTGDWEESTIGAIDSLDAKYATFGSAVEGMWRRLVVSVSPFTDKLLELVNDAMPQVMAAFDTFDAAVGPTMDGIGNTINTVVSWVNSLWEQFGTSVNDDAVEPLKYWQEWAATNLPMIETLFNNILTAIQGFWAMFGDDIMYIVGNTFDTVWTVIDTVMRTIGDVVTLALQLLTGDWEGAFLTMQGIVERIWEAIKTIIGNQLDSVRAAVMAIDWGETGNAIVQGIANGISAGAQYIVDAAETAANNALNAAKNWLGIHSPSTVAADDIGTPFAEGIGIGAQKGLHSIAGRIDSGLAGLMSSITTPQPAMATAASGITKLEMHIYLNGRATYEDGRNAGRGIYDELRSRGLG